MNLQLGGERIKVSAIVPIFNEEKTLRNVVTLLLESNLINEVVCVNDGSTDKSLEILKSFGRNIKLITYRKNQGKGYALAQGIKQAQGEILVFLDADLINLSEEHLELLLNPILKNQAKVVIGYFQEYLAYNIFQNLSGQRAYFKKDLISHLKEMKPSRYGVEIFLNGLFKKEEIIKVSLPGLGGLWQHEKKDLQAAFKTYLNLVTEMTRELVKKEIISLEDRKILEGLNRAIDFKDLRVKINKIRNKRVKDILKEYVLRYTKGLNQK